MALLRDLYNLTKYADEVEDTKDMLRFNSYATEAWKRYGKAKNISEKDALKIGKAALDKRYVACPPLNDRSGPPQKVMADTAGIELIHRTMFGLIPKGLILAWVDKNKSLAAFITSFVGGGLLTLLAIIVAVIKP